MCAPSAGAAEAVAARPGVDEYPGRDLADHRLPVRAHVVQAGPATPSGGVPQRRSAPDDAASRSASFVPRRSSKSSGSTVGSGWRVP